MPTSSEDSQKITHEIELRTLLLQEQTHNKKIRYTQIIGSINFIEYFSF